VEVEGGNDGRQHAHTPQRQENPYPLYAVLRDRDPVHFSPITGGWILTRYADIVEALREPRLSSSGTDARLAQLPPALRDQLAPFSRFLQRMMIKRDPPAHTLLRQILNGQFTPRAVEALRPTIQTLADTLLDAVRPRGVMDVIADFAMPLPGSVIGMVIGLPLDDLPTFARHAESLMTFSEIRLDIDPTAQLSRAHASLDWLLDYFAHLAAVRTHAPRGDLISAMMQAGLTVDVALANCVALLVAGHETVTNLIGNGLLALLRHPEQLALLRMQPHRIPAAVEECLRYDSSILATGRHATAAVEIGGKRIAAGQFVRLLLGSANHDPAQFAAPDDFDVTRHETHHLAFGHGAHHCLGAPLARLEGQIALATLLRRLPHIRLADKSALSWRGDMFTRGLISLPVAFDEPDSSVTTPRQVEERGQA